MNKTFCLLLLILLAANVYSLENRRNFSQYLPRIVQLSADAQWQNEFARHFGSLYDNSVVSSFSLGLLSSIIENKSTFPQKPDQAARFMMNYLVQIDREQKSNPRFLAVKLKFDRQLSHLKSSDIGNFQMANWKVIASEAGIVIPEERKDKSVDAKVVSPYNDLFISDKKIKVDKDKKDKVKIDKVKDDKIKEEKIKEDKIKENKLKTK